MFEFTAFIENLSKRTRGIISGVHLTFPTTTELVQAALNVIGVDGLRNEEILVTDYSISIPGLQSILGEYAHIDELNYLAHRIQDMTPEEQAKFAAAIRHGEYNHSLEGLINLTYNLDCYELLPDVKDYEDYGRYLVEIQRDFELPEQVAMYFDYFSYGEDSVINDGGDLTPQGYIYNNRSPFQEVYDGKNIPEEYRVFQYPMQARAKEQQRRASEKEPVSERGDDR